MKFVFHVLIISIVETRVILLVKTNFQFFFFIKHSHRIDHIIKFPEKKRIRSQATIHWNQSNNFRWIIFKWKVSQKMIWFIWIGIKGAIDSIRFVSFFLLVSFQMLMFYCFYLPGWKQSSSSAYLEPLIHQNRCQANTYTNARIWLYWCVSCIDENCGNLFFM